MADELYGLGVRIIPDRRRVELLFEAADMCDPDEDGTRAPAFFSIEYSLVESAVFKPLEEYEARARRIAKSGIKAYGIAPGQLTPITWQYYLDNYADGTIEEVKI